MLQDNVKRKIFPVPLKVDELVETWTESIAGYKPGTR